MWKFIQDELLGMNWLERLLGRGLLAANVDIDSRIGGTLHFFLYDVIKIMLLLCFLIFIISYIQSFFPPERSRRILGRFNGITARIVSALLGTVTPFCSCSSIPLFIGFTRAGLPLGVTFSFLISSPMVDLGSVVLLTSIFGWKVAIAYVVLGLIVAVAGGTLIEKLRLDNQVENIIGTDTLHDTEQSSLTIRARCVYAWEQVLSTAEKVYPYVLCGVAIGSL
ncbi:MAG: permease, partial [Kiritimatiellae bacterium]|nr:permease [Kiritimatiellia bacterium]